MIIDGGRAVRVMLHGLPRPLLLLLRPKPPAYRLFDGRRRLLDVDPSRAGDQPIFRKGLAVAATAASPMERSEDDLLVEAPHVRHYHEGSEAQHSAGASGLRLGPGVDPGNWILLTAAPNSQTTTLAGSPRPTGRNSHPAIWSASGVKPSAVQFLVLLIGSLLHDNLSFSGERRVSSSATAG